MAIVVDWKRRAARYQTMAATDYYEILQVSPNADEEIIHAAFRQLALKWHPDRCPADEFASERMKTINKAYEVLSNPQTRSRYDQWRRQSTPRPATVKDSPVAAERRNEHRKGPAELDQDLAAVGRDVPQTAEQRKRVRKPHKSKPGHALRDYFREASRVQAFAACFIGLSLADLLMTYLLLRTVPHFHESNLVARLIFERWNIMGMTIFKIAVVMVVVALAEVIERHRFGWGRLVLLGGCGATAFAFLRGLQLFLGHAP